jgi:hypothetical protein
MLDGPPAINWRPVETKLAHRVGSTRNGHILASASDGTRGVSGMQAKHTKQNKVRVTVGKGRLPYAERAWADERKFTEYALNPDKSDKARGFAVKLGIYREDWVYLHDQIMSARRRRLARRLMWMSTTTRRTDPPSRQV